MEAVPHSPFSQKEMLEKIQKQTDEYIKMIDKIADAKEKEVLKV